METITKPVTGTHNSMTFYRPAKWYGYLMIPFARCQRQTIRGQFDVGVRCFDLRIRFHRDGTPCFAHGLMELKGDVQGTLLVVNALAHHAKCPVYVRLVLEDGQCRDWQEKLFRAFCKIYEEKFPLITFFQGNRKADWKQVYEFTTKPQLAQCVGSMAADARWYERLVPWFYARRRNKKNLADPPSADIALYDFL